MYNPDAIMTQQMAWMISYMQNRAVADRRRKNEEDKIINSYSLRHTHRQRATSEKELKDSKKQDKLCLEQINEFRKENGIEQLTPKNRECLKCGKLFRSSGCHERNCGCMKTSNVSSGMFAEGRLPGWY